jgi:multidrug efflux pump subunit AcrA (membrane-fusion protein)
MASADAAVRCLRVRPKRAANLCFPVHGIIDEVHVALGEKIIGFGLQEFYNNLGATPDPSTLTYNSQAISNALTDYFLMTLRNEPAKALLDKAIGLRQNIYYKNVKYSDTTGYINRITTYTNNNEANLGQLQAALTAHQTLLSDMYQGTFRTGVVTHTTSNLSSTTQTSETSNTTETSAVEGFASGSEGSKGQLNQTQTITNTGYTYRAPLQELTAKATRTQMTLQDQILAAYITGRGSLNLAITIPNELAGVDLDVRQLQVAYINTILTAPFSGTVTRVWKDSGDYARAGEPVVRVEDATTLYLEGTIDYPGIIALGSNVTVATTLPGASSAMTITGVFIAVEGRKSDDWQWDVTIQVSESSAPLPTNFSLDRASTKIVIS